MNFNNKDSNCLVVWRVEIKQDRKKLGKVPDKWNEEVGMGLTG